MSKAENKLAEELARQIANDLFTNGFGEKASRLVMNNETFQPPKDLGGWSKDAVASRVTALLEPHLVGEGLRERVRALMMSKDGSAHNDSYNSALWDVLELLDAPPKGEQS